MRNAIRAYPGLRFPSSSVVAGTVPTIVLWNCHATLGVVCRQKVHSRSVGSQEETKGRRGGEDGKNVKVLIPFFLYENNVVISIEKSQNGRGA